MGERQKVLTKRFVAITLALLLLAGIIFVVWGIPRIQAKRSWYKEPESVKVTIYVDDTDQGQITTNLIKWDGEREVTKVRFTGYKYSKDELMENRPAIKISVGNNIVIVKKHVYNTPGEGYVRNFKTNSSGTEEENYKNLVFYYNFYKTKEEDHKGFFAQMEVNIILAE